MILNLAPSRKAIEKTLNITQFRASASILSFRPLYAMINLVSVLFHLMFPYDFYRNHYDK